MERDSGENRIAEVIKCRGRRAPLAVIRAAMLSELLATIVQKCGRKPYLNDVILVPVTTLEIEVLNLATRQE